MALCGFNKKMLEGLTAFNEGLVEYGLKNRSQKNGETTGQALRREISDMTRLLAETHKLEDSGKRIMTEGLVRYAMGVYLLVRANGIDCAQEVIRSIGEYFQAMDGKYYSELEGSPNDMDELVKF